MKKESRGEQLYGEEKLNHQQKQLAIAMIAYMAKIAAEVEQIFGTDFSIRQSWKQTV